MEKEETEFDLLVQRTKQRLVLGEQIRETVRLFQRTSYPSERVSKREIVSRKLQNLGQNLPFFKKL